MWVQTPASAHSPGGLLLPLLQLLREIQDGSSKVDRGSSTCLPAPLPYPSLQCGGFRGLPAPGASRLYGYLLLVIS